MSISVGRTVGKAIVKMLGIDMQQWKVLDVSIDIGKDKVATLNFSVAIEEDTFKKLDKALNADGK